MNTVNKPPRLLREGLDAGGLGGVARGLGEELRPGGRAKRQGQGGERGVFDNRLDFTNFYLLPCLSIVFQ